MVFQKEVMRLLLSVMLALSIANSAFAGETEEEENIFHQLVLQISDNDPKRMTSVLNVAANVSRHYSGIGHEVEIRIVAINNGMHMLRADTSPVADRVRNFSKSMPNVEFIACGNTIDTMERLEGKRPQLIDEYEIAPAGVVAIIQAHEEGWTVVKP
ncbi:MAG: DsrE family protein [Sneathiellales bacterium]|nr:DsrE family protein [Sneathiellales bacterium]